MVSRRVVLVLVAAAVVLPMAIALIVGVARLLSAMQDPSGAAGLDRLALVAGMVWALDLIVLVTVGGVNSLFPPDDEA